VSCELRVDGGDNDTPADDQYDGGGGDNGGVEDPNDVVDNTTSNQQRPTGGVPLLGPAVVALAFEGVGFSVLRTSIRRDP
jgi:hypothetical protein